jgi:UDP-glucuronate 4-epimerase
MKVLVTGAAGFIGAHVAQRLSADGHAVVGVDNMNAYYDPTLKTARVENFLNSANFIAGDITDESVVRNLFTEHTFDRVCHLAAQAGVRYSIENPFTYAQSNYVGTQYLFEYAHRAGGIPVVYASSSSVYGDQARIPFSETDPCTEPLSVYAATKRANELLAHVYATMHHMSMTGLRFFTVYGPWGRPDMAYFSFTKKILSGVPIELYNNGELLRDFTYIDDIVSGVSAALNNTTPGYSVYNLGRGQPVSLRAFVSAIENALGRKAEIQLAPMQGGDVHQTYADVSKARAQLGYMPVVSLPEGVQRFVEWYRAYYNV